MATAFAVEETIERPQSEVWAALTDWEAAPRWMAGIEALVADGDLAPCTKLVFRSRGKDRPSEIASVEPERRVVLRSRQGSVTADYTYELASAGANATKVRLVADCRTRGLLWSLASPALRWAVRRTDGGQLAALKRLVEDGERSLGVKPRV